MYDLRRSNLYLPHLNPLSILNAHLKSWHSRHFNECVSGSWNYDIVREIFLSRISLWGSHIGGLSRLLKHKYRKCMFLLDSVVSA